MGSGLTKGEPEPAVRAWAGYGSGLGSGPGFIQYIMQGMNYSVKVKKVFE